MVKDNVAITYSPYNRKFYAGKFDGEGTDFSKDYGMEAIAKLNPDKKIGDGRIEPISYETFRSAEAARRKPKNSKKQHAWATTSDDGGCR